jgi:protein pelota
VYNLVRTGDLVTATTFRKIQRESGAGQESEKVKLKLSIRVEAIDFDPEGQEIRLSGRNLTENEHVKLGAHHTLQLEPHRTFQLSKAAWDGLDLARIREACDPSVSADLAVVLITEGLANVCLVGASITVVAAKVEGSIPRKRGAAAAGYDKALDRFFDKVLLATVRHVDWDIVKCLVIAGPGFAKDKFLEYLTAEAVKRELKPFQTHKRNILVAQASSAFKHSLKELFAAPGLAVEIKDTKAAREVKVLQDFFSMLSSDPARAFYGPGHVHAAHELGAIQTLLITDTLFRVNDVMARLKYSTLVEEVESGGGAVFVFSGMHATGEQLDQLTGLAAILRFPLPDLEDAEFEPDGTRVDEAAA